MKKDKSKPISYNAISKNRRLGEFFKEEVVDRAVDVSKMTWDLVVKFTKNIAKKK